MCKSEAQLTGSQGCLLQRFYSWNSTTTSSLCYRKNSNPQIHSPKEDHPWNISWGHRSSQLCWSLDHNSGEFYLIIHSDQTTKLELSLFSFCLLSFLGWLHLTRHIFLFDKLTFIRERILCKIMCHPATKGRIYIYVEQQKQSPPFQCTRFEFQASQSLRLSAQTFFFLASLWSSIRIKKKLDFSQALIMGKPML
jgi:hypothetical protein